MKDYIILPDIDGNFYYTELELAKESINVTLEIENVFIIKIFKYNDNRYDLSCFFYRTKFIYSKKRFISLNALCEKLQLLINLNFMKNNQ